MCAEFAWASAWGNRCSPRYHPLTPPPPPTPTRGTHTQIPWPAFVSGMWSASDSAVTLPLGSGFASCSLDVDAYATFRAVALSPVLAAVALLIIPAVSACRRRGRPHWTLYQTGVLVAAYLLYPSVSQQAVRMLDCSPLIAGVRYLESDFRVECGTPTHTLHAALAVAVILVFCLGFPVGLGVRLWLLHRRGRLHERRVRKRLLFLYDSYRPEVAYWEGVVILRK